MTSSHCLNRIVSGQAGVRTYSTQLRVILHLQVMRCVIAHSLRQENWYVHMRRLEYKAQVILAHFCGSLLKYKNVFYSKSGGAEEIFNKGNIFQEKFFTRRHLPFQYTKPFHIMVQLLIRPHNKETNDRGADGGQKLQRASLFCLSFTFREWRCTVQYD